MKIKHSMTVLCIGACLCHAARADETKPDNELSTNASVVTDYSYRGISQTRLQPALQGGADYVNNPTGLYVGTWLSTIKWIDDAGGSDGVEWDLYAGKRGNITADLSYDIGVLSYVYPGNGLRPNANTTELYGQLGYGPAYIKCSQSVTDLFGFADSRNSGYLDVGAIFDVVKDVQLTLHAGHQSVRNNAASSYSDWKVGLTKDFGFASLGVAAVGTNSDAYYGPLTDHKNLGKTRLILSLAKTF